MLELYAGILFSFDLKDILHILTIKSIFMKLYVWEKYRSCCLSNSMQVFKQEPDKRYKRYRIESMI